MKHQPMQTEQRWAYVQAGRLGSLAGAGATKADVLRWRAGHESVQRVEIRLVPKKRKVTP
jgi:hypothetical protein